MVQQHLYKPLLMNLLIYIYVFIKQRNFNRQFFCQAATTIRRGFKGIKGTKKHRYPPILYTSERHHKSNTNGKKRIFLVQLLLNKNTYLKIKMTKLT